MPGGILTLAYAGLAIGTIGLVATIVLFPKLPEEIDDATDDPRPFALLNEIINRGE